MVTHSASKALTFNYRIVCTDGSDHECVDIVAIKGILNTLKQLGLVPSVIEKYDAKKRDYVVDEGLTESVLGGKVSILNKAVPTAVLSLHKLSTHADTMRTKIKGISDSGEAQVWLDRLEELYYAAVNDFTAATDFRGDEESE